MASSPILKALAVYLLYAGLIFVIWTMIGVDYNNLVAAEVVVSSLLLPLACGTVLIVAAITTLGWWRPVLREDAPSGSRWTSVPLVLLMSAFFAINAITTDWSAISALHLAILVTASLLVGFNEEALARGVLVTAFRKASYSEKGVWFYSSFLFGLSHVPNAFFGTGLAGGLGQAVLAFFGATAYYILRRTSGTLLVPILFHAGWDFSLFAQQASKAPAASFPAFLLDIGVSLVAICLLFFVVRSRSVGKEAQT